MSKFYESPYPGNGYVIEQVEGGWQWRWQEVGEADDLGPILHLESWAFESAAEDWTDNGTDFTGHFAGRLKAQATKLRKAGR